MKDSTTTWPMTFTYDAAGNLAGRTGPLYYVQTMTWDETGHLTAATQQGSTVATMVYGADGERLVRQQTIGTTVYVGGAEITLNGTVVSAIRYYEHNGMVIAAWTSNDDAGLVMVVPDWQGTSHAQVGLLTGAVAVFRHHPYGSPRGSGVQRLVGDKGFAGGTQDSDARLTLVGARYYDPVIGEFVSPDPVLDGGNPRMLDAYGYGHASPVTFSDRTGLKPLADGNYEFKGSNQKGWDLWTLGSVSYNPQTELVMAKKPQMVVEGRTPPPIPLYTDPIGHRRTPVPVTKEPLAGTIAPPPSLPDVTPSIGWDNVWRIGAAASSLSPPLVAANMQFTLLAGDVASIVELATGGECYWEGSVRITVCYGGKMAAGRAGTTFGTTFIARPDPNNPNLDPRTLRDTDPESYAALMGHEKNHTRQYLTLGPLMLGYFANEAIAETIGASMGCMNVFEWSAGWSGGNYECP